VLTFNRRLARSSAWDVVHAGYISQFKVPEVNDYPSGLLPHLPSTQVLGLITFQSSIMKFFKSAVVLGLVTGVFAAPVLQDSSSDIATRLTELEDTVYGINNEKRVAGLDFSSNLLQARATITDVKCRDNGITYSKAQITDAVAAENSQENPGKYNNQEGGKKLFNTNVQLYKTSLDSKLPSTQR
jgi:hypothetical protein